MLKKSKSIGKYALLSIFLLFSIFPFYWMVIGATNESSSMFAYPPNFSLGTKIIENFTNLDSSIGITRVLINSLVVSLITLVLSLSISTMCAYALSKFKFKGANLLLGVLLVAQMIPMQTKVVPLFSLMVNLDLLNSYFALIAPNLVYPLGILLLKQSFEAMPEVILESARLDGASEFYIFWKIVLPPMKPSLVSAAILIFMNSWNNFMWPLVATTSSDMYTFPVALSSLSSATYTDFGQMMMGLSIATIPIVIFFLVLQKHFISGMLGSAVK
ncbi:carbohydrate ABC transporter permease [Enterococcus songbeiensis]|uniref:carbohydrate ABC transporter permease n=1 Tax=Enterococcus songbeiensis TaxID=2559927 RepID=UPI0010F66CF1|nr:carbohydrate ABC transporter permease [Enterococcus songbeiensis]